MFALCVISLITTWEYAIIKFGFFNLPSGKNWVEWFGTYSYILISKYELNSSKEIQIYQRIYTGLFMFINVWVYTCVGYIFFDKYLTSKLLEESIENEENEGDEEYRTMIEDDVFGDAEKNIQNYPF